MAYNAKKLDFSVDRVFCKSCETKFGAIETQFIDSILSRFRNHDFRAEKEIALEDVQTIRRFFLLQVWRTSICDPSFTISETLQEKLRILLLDENSPIDQITSIPLSITYLNTEGDKLEYTKNYVGTGSLHEQNVIFFNDFFIQIFEGKEAAKYDDWFGLNNPNTFEHFINKGEKAFKFKILSNEERLQFAVSYSQYKAKKVNKQYQQLFERCYYLVFRKKPTPKLTYRFIHGIVNDTKTTEAMKYSNKRIIQYTLDFINRL